MAKLATPMQRDGRSCLSLSGTRQNGQQEPIEILQQRSALGSLGRFASSVWRFLGVPLALASLPLARRPCSGTGPRGTSVWGSHSPAHLDCNYATRTDLQAVHHAAKSIQRVKLSTVYRLAEKKVVPASLRNTGIRQSRNARLPVVRQELGRACGLDVSGISDDGHPATRGQNNRPFHIPVQS